MEQKDDLEVINSRFQLQQKVGTGSFGSVYKAIDKSNGAIVAVKIEENSDIISFVVQEAKVLKIMKGVEGFPSLIFQGEDEKSKKQFLVLDLFDRSLEDYFNQCSRKFSLKTLIMLADQLIKRIESIHKKNLLYRDVKPENFMIGFGKAQFTVFIIDFGIVKKYKDIKTGKHIQYTDGKPLTGTARYVSLNTHFGIEQSRRDDLESLGYLFIYFLKGRLPWSGMQIESKEEKYDKIKLKKQNTSLEALCEGLPEEFVEYMKYCKTLKFEENPDYSYLKKLFKDLFFRLGYNWDYEFDWLISETERDQLIQIQEEYVKEQQLLKIKENVQIPNEDGAEQLKQTFSPHKVDCQQSETN